MWPWSSSSGTVSVKVSDALQPQHVGDRLVVGEELDELRDAAVVAELLLDRLVAAQVADHQLEARDDERGLAGAAEQALELEVGVLGEDLPVGPEPDAGAGACPWPPARPCGSARTAA